MTINAFTLKELRQLTRTKSIAVSLVAFLFVALAIAYAVPVFAGMRQDTGEMMFAGINGLLELMLCVVLPSEVFSFLDRERGSSKERVDFTMLTALPPSEVIDGKLRGAFALMALFSTAALPFGVLAHLMHGITFVSMLRELVLTLCASCVATHVALALAAMKLPRIVRRCLYVVFMAVVVGLAFASLPESVVGGEGAFWRVVALSATACAILRGFAISFFAPAVMERDASLRVTIAVAAVGWLVFALATRDDGALAVWLVSSVVCSLALAIYSMAQPLGYSRRMVASRPRRAALRVLWFPLSSGAVNGFAFACLVGALAAAVARFVAAGWLMPVRNGPGAWSVATFLMYFFAVLLLTRWAWRIFFSRRFPPVVVPLLAVGIFLFLQTVAPYMGFDGDAVDLNSTPFYCLGILAEPEMHFRQAAIAFAATLAPNLATSAVAAFLRRRGK